MAIWFTDSDGDLWRFSKYAGGIQAENSETGEWGRVMILEDAVEQFGIRQLSRVESAVCDEFEKWRTENSARNNWRDLRATMLDLVRHIHAPSGRRVEPALTAAPLVYGPDGEQVQPTNLDPAE